MKKKGYDALKKGLTFIELLINSESIDQETFLPKMAKFLSLQGKSDSCLIYVFDEKEKETALVASKNSSDPVKKIKLKKGEGITGWVVEHKKTVFISQKAYKDFRFKFFQELPQDKYEAFLSIPILLKNHCLGVVNLQYKKPAKLTKSEIEVLNRLVDIISYSFSIYVLKRNVEKLSKDLKNRKLIERAKGILMKKLEISEDEAYSKLRTEAMHQRKKIEDLATSIVLLEKII